MSICPINNRSSYASNMSILPALDLNKITKVAIVALVAGSMVQEVHAVSMEECFKNCDSHRDAHEIAKLICYTLCAIFAKG